MKTIVMGHIHRGKPYHNGTIKQSLGRAASQQNIINSHNRTLSTEEYRTPLIHTTEHYLQNIIHFITPTSLIHTTEHYLRKSTEHHSFTQQNIIYRRVQNIIHFITPTSLIHTTEHYLRKSTEH